jgi:diaminopimelate decarboxylase
VGRPPVIAVRDGRVQVLLRRETDDDLSALDMGWQT